MAQNHEDRVGHFVQKIMQKPLVLPNIDKVDPEHGDATFTIKNQLSRSTLKNIKGLTLEHYDNPSLFSLGRMLNKDGSNNSFISYQTQTNKDRISRKSP